MMATTTPTFTTTTMTVLKTDLTMDIDNDGIDNYKDIYDNGSDASRDHDNDGLK